MSFFTYFIFSSLHPSLPIALEAAATCLSVESFRLSDALTQKFMKLRGEEITTPLTLEQVNLYETH